MSSSEVETIKNFYDGSEIFITGGTGYIGKVLIDKLLRSCTRIKSIYLLMRPKKDKTAAERIQEMSDCMVRFICESCELKSSAAINYSYLTC
jgi:alcohol-forming fatty acyl-CoA reductase